MRLEHPDLARQTRRVGDADAEINETCELGTRWRATLEGRPRSNTTGAHVAAHVVARLTQGAQASTALTSPVVAINSITNICTAREWMSDTVSTSHDGRVAEFNTAPLERNQLDQSLTAERRQNALTHVQSQHTCAIPTHAHLQPSSRKNNTRHTSFASPVARIDGRACSSCARRTRAHFSLKQHATRTHTHTPHNLTHSPKGQSCQSGAEALPCAHPLELPLALPQVASRQPRPPV